MLTARGGQTKTLIVEQERLNLGLLLIQNPLLFYQHAELNTVRLNLL